jgi:hypothetical protein
MQLTATSWKHLSFLLGACVLLYAAHFTLAFSFTGAPSWFDALPAALYPLCLLWPVMALKNPNAAMSRGTARVVLILFVLLLCVPLFFLWKDLPVIFPHTTIAQTLQGIVTYLYFAPSLAVSMIGSYAAFLIGGIVG